MLAAVPSFFRTIINCYTILKKERVDRVITTGGFIAIPVSIAAFFARVPIDLYELNAIPGTAASYVAYVATHIYVCFAKALSYFPAKKSQLRPYPIQFNKNHAVSKEACYKKLGFNPCKKTILILGGSQGSLFINKIIKSLIATHAIPASTIQLIHQTGHLENDDLTTFYNEHNIPALVFAYNHNLQELYSVADVVLCRAGAGTLFESIFFDIPIITIPLETATTHHQLDNAYDFAQQHPQRVTVIRQSVLEHSILPLSEALRTYLGTMLTQ